MPYIVKTFTTNETLKSFLNKEKIKPNNIQYIRCSDTGIWDICVWTEENNSCKTCLHNDYSMPQCRECPDNNYKYHSLKIDY